MSSENTSLSVTVVTTDGKEVKHALPNPFSGPLEKKMFDLTIKRILNLTGGGDTYFLMFDPHVYYNPEHIVRIILDFGEDQSEEVKAQVEKTLGFPTQG